MLSYLVKFPNPELHYVEVELTLVTPENQWVEMYMPVWTPGSYMIREFSRHLDKLSVQNKDNQVVVCDKITKNTWRFFSDSSNHIIKYRIYANELTVRTNHVNTEHAMLNGAATFLTVKGYEQYSHQIEFQPYKNWKEISCSLPQVNGKWAVVAENYDLLLDSPVEIGNQQIIEFHAGGILHELVLIGESNGNYSLLVNDLKTIIDEEVKLFGCPHPCEKYIFILHHTDNVYGGLEHLHCSVNMVPRWDYFPRDKYLRTISLLAHEYFHLWNIKRIHPLELGPFDYSQENYTRQLWAIEGVTSYYDDYFVYLAGVAGLDEYLNNLATNLSNVVNSPGNTEQSLGESSFDAWIKYYRGHENTHNNQVNYYTKGANVVIALNLLIMHLTAGQKSLDDMMKVLYEMYLKRPHQGYSEEELLKVCEEVAGSPLGDFFEKYIFGAEELDYAMYFSFAGLQLQEVIQEEYDLGWILEDRGSSFWVSKVNIGASAASAGLNANDEILALNGYRMTTQWKRFISSYSVGQKVDVLVSRSGVLKSIEMTLLPSRKKQYTLHPMDNISIQQAKIQNLWLKV